MLFSIPVYHAIPVQSPVYFIIAVCHTPCGSVLTKTCVICCSFSSVFCVWKFQSCGSTFHVCVCVFLSLETVAREGHLQSVTPDRNWVSKHKGSSCEGCLCLCHWEIYFVTLGASGTERGVTPPHPPLYMRNSWTILGLQVRRKTEEEIVKVVLSDQSETWCPLEESSHPDWILKVHRLSFFIFAHQSQCWDWISASTPSYKQFSVLRKKTVTVQHNTKKNNKKKKTWSQPVKKRAG